MLMYSHNYLRTLRQKNKMSQKMVADKMGISLRQYNRLECTNPNDMCYLSHKQIIQLSQIFGEQFKINELYYEKPLSADYNPESIIPNEE